jgi:glutaminyl-tRNA synthetase
MRDGMHAEGSMVLRAKIDMASPNINLRDPAIYRVRKAAHHRTGDKWCVYPVYTFAHPIEDALERVTHSICTLEFEDQRPFYDWLLEHLADLGLLARPLPKQYEFGRLNLTGVITSKRKLKALVDEGHVSGWDDPRMPTLFGMRRRGYTPESIRAMADGTGASKTNIWLDYTVLDIALREDLEGRAPRAMAVLDPVKLVLENWDEVFSPGHREPCSAPAHPQHPALGLRHFSLSPQVWIEREDFEIIPPKGFFRLYPPQAQADGSVTPGNKVRLKYGMVVECMGFDQGADGRVTAVRARVVPDTKSGTPGADAVKVKGTITWLSADDAVAAEVRLFERLFTEDQPDAEGRDFRSVLNPASRRAVQAFVEPSLAAVASETRFQFERHGYFVADRIDHRSDHSAGQPVFNRITTLKDSWK